MCLVNTPSPAAPDPKKIRPDYLHNQALDNLRNSLSYVRAAREGVNALTIPMASSASSPAAPVAGSRGAPAGRPGGGVPSAGLTIGGSHPGSGARV